VPIETNVEIEVKMPVVENALRDFREIANICYSFEILNFYTQ
jgi:hypothetical protein